MALIGFVCGRAWWSISCHFDISAFFTFKNINATPLFNREIDYFSLFSVFSSTIFNQCSLRKATAMSSEEVTMNSDVVVKQEHSATDSNEKNPSTAQPSQAKPAQEQTRTENLQRIQQRKLKVILVRFNYIRSFFDHISNPLLQIYKLPKPQKMAKLSMYSGMGIMLFEWTVWRTVDLNFSKFRLACQKCRCTGWKTQEENRHRDVESNYCPKFTEECRNPSCKHPLGKLIRTVTDSVLLLALILLCWFSLGWD